MAEEKQDPKKKVSIEEVTKRDDKELAAYKARLRDIEAQLEVTVTSTLIDAKKELKAKISELEAR